MKHIIEKQQTNQLEAILLFHGTGGNEYDLLPLGRYYSPKANLVSFRGDVLEQGMNRFFKRIRSGVFDQEDLANRVINLENTIQEICQNYQIKPQNIGLVGYSNGANMILAYLLRNDHPFRFAILHHPMIPFREILPNRQNAVPILIQASDNDPLVGLSETNELHQLLLSNHFFSELNLHHDGHQLSNQEVETTKKWLDQHGF